MRKKSALRSANKQKAIAVFCSGSGSNLQALIKAQKLNALGGRIALVMCDQPSAYALVRANKAKIPVALIERSAFESKANYEQAVLGVLKQYQIDLVVLAGFMRILSADFIRAVKGRILNIHPSLLPSFKGAHAVRDALSYGVRVTGVTVHLVTDDLDAGPILMQEAVVIKKNDTEATLLKRVHQVEHQLYSQAIRQYIKSFK